MEEKSLKEKLQSIADNLDKLVKEKEVSKWSPPWKARILGKKKKREGYVVFVNLGENKAITFIKAPVSEGVALVNKIPHRVDPEDIFLWKNKIPMVIMPQWSEGALSAREHYKATQQVGNGSEGWQLIMNYILKNMITAKKNIPWGAIAIGALVLLGLGFYAMKSGVLS